MGNCLILRWGLPRARSRASDGNETPVDNSAELHKKKKSQKKHDLRFLIMLHWASSWCMESRLDFPMSHSRGCWAWSSESRDWQCATKSHGGSGTSGRAETCCSHPISTLAGTLRCHHLQPQLRKRGTKHGDALWEVTPQSLNQSKSCFPNNTWILLIKKTPHFFPMKARTALDARATNN